VPKQGVPAAQADPEEREQIYVCISTPAEGAQPCHLITAADDTMRRFDLKATNCAAEWCYKTRDDSPWVSGGIDRNTNKTAFVFDAAVAPSGAQASPVASTILVGLGDGTMRLTDMRTQGEVAAVGAHEKWTTGVSFSDDGLYVASTWGSGAAIVWDVRTWQATATLRGHEGAAYGCSFWPGNSSLLLTWSADATLRLWDAHTESQRTLALLTMQDYPVYATALSPDSRSMVVAGGPAVNVGGVPGWVHPLVEESAEGDGGWEVDDSDEPDAIGAIMGM